MRLFGSAVAVGVLTFSSVAFARSHRVDNIPNGAARGCLNCHLTNTGQHFTDFGSDVRAHLVGDGLEIRDREVDWAAVYAKDSDGDTYTNGEELGDPDGTWRIGDPNPPGPTTNPGDEESFPPGVCGNGVLEPDEGCEDDVWRFATCAEADMGEGELSCSSCQLSFSDCSLGAAGGSGAAPSGSDEEEGCAVSSPGASGTGETAALCSVLAGLWALRRRRRRP